MPTIPTHAANGADMPVLGLGTFTLKDDVARDMVELAIGLGYRHIDTAIMYENEQAVGEGIRSSGNARDELFITSKVWPTNVRDGVFQREVEGSLGRLGIDALDLVLIHWPSPGTDMATHMRVLNDVAERGLARHIGVSNFTAPLLREAVALSDRPLAANQMENHPYLDERAAKAVCDKHGIAFTAYCPIFRGGALFEEEAVTAPAKAHGKTEAQVVLRWHIQHGGLAIPKTATPARLEENMDIFDFELSADEMASLDALRSANNRICQWDGAPAWDVSFAA